MLRELREIVSPRKEDTWNIIFLTMKWKPLLENKPFCLLKKKKGTICAGWKADMFLCKFCVFRRIGCKVTWKKRVKLSPCGNIFIGFTQLLG